MNQPTLAEGIEDAFRGIESLKARAAAMACRTDLSTVAISFRERHPACNPRILDEPAPAFPRLDHPNVIKEFGAVKNACKKLAVALEGLGPSSLEMLGHIPETIHERDFWTDDLRHWVGGKAGEFFPVQDYEVTDPGAELVPKGGKPGQAPILQRLAHVAAMMASLSQESHGWTSEAAKGNYSRTSEALGARAERRLIYDCGKVLLSHGHGLSHLAKIAESMCIFGLGGKPGDKINGGDNGRWQERGFREIRKELRRWWKTAYFVDDGLLF